MNRWLPATLLLLLLVAFRVLGSLFPENLPNIQPLLALLLCSLVFLKGIQRWLLPLIAWLVTDPLTSLLQGHDVFGWHHLAIVLGVAATVAIANIAKRNPSILVMLVSATASAVAFYFLTNLVSFAIDPLYAKTAQGFLQAEWAGPSGLGPTWLFLRNSLVANFVFTGLFLIARQSQPQTSAKAPALAR